MKSSIIWGIKGNSLTETCIIELTAHFTVAAYNNDSHSRKKENTGLRSLLSTYYTSMSIHPSVHILELVIRLRLK